MRIYLKCTLQFFLLSIVIAGNSQNVSFDSTFGVNARTFTQNGNASVFASVYKFTTVKSDGSFFMAGDYSQPDTNYFVTKFKPTGSIDSSFAANGKLFIKRANFGINAILSSGIDSSNRFFFVGRIPSPSGSNFFRLRAVRYTADARVDSSFGINGIADMPFDNLVLSGIEYPVAAYKNGRLLISHLLYEGINSSCGLVRLKENGKLDSSFGLNGKVFLPAAPGLTTFYTLDIQPDEKILFTRLLNSVVGIFRYNTNGTIDNSFNQNGIVNIDYPATFNSIQAIRILSNNKILLSAGSIAGYYLYRFHANGTRDSSFGGIGYVPYKYGYSTRARDFAEQPDGKILAAGVIQDNQQPFPNINTLITRTNIDGSIDSTFDNDGVWFFNYAGDPASGMKHIALLQSGKILFSGLESGAGWAQFVTYRLKEVSVSAPSVVWSNSSVSVIANDCSSQVKINWSTTSEANTSYFKIQHSTNNVQFNTIAQIAAAGNSISIKNYEYIHASPQVGNNYYKISVITTDGREFIYGTLTGAVTSSAAPLFQWEPHETIKRLNNDCLSAIKLHYKTLRPLVSDSIIIEHSTDSLNFATIARVAVNNPQAPTTNYEYIHQNPVLGKNYYRLRTKDPSGSCYSVVYKAELKDINNIIIYPVPATDKIFFSQSLPEGSQLTIFDMKGSLVLSKTFVSATNRLDLPLLASGQYIMKVYTSCNEKVFRFIKMP